jgi:hypothetical protein
MSAWGEFAKIFTQGGGNHMKSNKVCFCCLVVLVVIMGFAVGTVHSQDLSGWVGKWFKVNYSTKGYETTSEGSYIPRTDNGKGISYLKITAWDTTNPSDPLLRYSAYGQEDGSVNETINYLHYLGGTDLDFLCLDVLTDDSWHQTFTSRITGKESRGILKSATFKTMGGIYWEKNQYDPRESYAGSITITGTLISESKLPSWVPK